MLICEQSKMYRNAFLWIEYVYSALLLFEQSNCIGWQFFFSYSCNVIKPKTTAQIVKKEQKQVTCNFFTVSFLNCYRFLPSLNMNQVPEKLYLGQWPYMKKKIASQCNLTVQIKGHCMISIIYIYCRKISKSFALSAKQGRHAHFFYPLLKKN
jgi:hypothetical protein